MRSPRRCPFSSFRLPISILASVALCLALTTKAWAIEMSFSFEATLDQPFGSLNAGDTLTGFWTVDTAAGGDLIPSTLGAFQVTRFEVVDPTGGTWSDQGAAFVANDLPSPSPLPGFECQLVGPPCDAYAVGFDGENSMVSGNFAGFASIADLDPLGSGLTLAELGFGLTYEGATGVFASTGHPTDDTFFPAMSLASGGVFIDIDGAETMVVPFATTSLASPPSLVPEPSLLMLMGSGLAGLAGWRWRQHRLPKAS